jgi:hypothetical protein
VLQEAKQIYHPAAEAVNKQKEQVTLLSGRVQKQIS